MKISRYFPAHKSDGNVDEEDVVEEWLLRTDMAEPKPNKEVPMVHGG